MPFGHYSNFTRYTRIGSMTSYLGEYESIYYIKTVTAVCVTSRVCKKHLNMDWIIYMMDKLGLLKTDILTMETCACTSPKAKDYCISIAVHSLQCITNTLSYVANLQAD